MLLLYSLTEGSQTKRNTHSGACLRSCILSWPFTSDFKAGRCFSAWAVTPCSSECACNAARHGPGSLLWGIAAYFFSPYLLIACRTDNVPVARQAMTVQMYWTCPVFWEHWLISHAECFQLTATVMHIKQYSTSFSRQTKQQWLKCLMDLVMQWKKSQFPAEFGFLWI